MRDRGQKPDSYTYTVLLRGLTQHVAKTPTAVQRALTIIGLLQSPQSPVQLHTIHVNAALEVCAKARNIDAVYSIAARLPEKGPGSPNSVTFTIILECLYQTAVHQVNFGSNLSEWQKSQIKAETVLQGKRLWADVLERWKQNILTMDELLMDAMGRVLLLGDARNHDEVLSLVQQATNLSREVPAIGEPDRHVHVKVPRKELDGPSADGPSRDAENGATELAVGSHTDGEAVAVDTTSPKLFGGLQTPSRLISFAQPGKRTLSLVMKACGVMKAYSAAQRYWDKLTVSVDPDLDNYHQYMRTIAARHNSYMAVELLRQICTPTDQDGLGLVPRPITFRLAMAACSSDGNNRRCLEHARAILQLQQAHIKVPEARTSHILVDLLLKRNGQWPVSEMSATLEALEETRRNLKSFTTFGHGEPRSGRASRDDAEVDPSPEFSKEVADLTRKIYRLLENAISIYREGLDKTTFHLWNRMLSRNRNKAVREKLSRREEWFRMQQLQSSRHAARDGEERHSL